MLKSMVGGVVLACRTEAVLMGDESLMCIGTLPTQNRPPLTWHDDISVYRQPDQPACA
jgi:hypothetical protein